MVILVSVNLAHRPEDIPFLRRAFAVALRSRENGDHPFGSILVNTTGEVVREQTNGYTSHHNNRTAHAEMLLASWAATHLSLEKLQGCTLYTSAEPCAMCAGAIYWAGIGRVVYGQSEKSLRESTGDNEQNPTMNLECRHVFSAGQRKTQVVGPLLEDEAKRLQEGFWDK
jgi:tRNA(Arg) A34 adenosine deaminase TadA